MNGDQTRPDVGRLEPEMMQRFEAALERLTGSRQSNLRPLTAVLMFPIAGLALQVPIVGIVCGIVLGIVGYLRTRTYLQRWTESIPNLSVWVPMGEVEFGDTIRCQIEIADGMGADKGLQYGLMGWSVRDAGGLMARIRPNWKSDLVYERWFPLEMTTGGAEHQVPLPDFEPAFLPRPEPETLVGPIGLRHHTRWVVAVRQQRYGLDWRRSEAPIRSLSRVITTHRPEHAEPVND